MNTTTDDQNELMALELGEFGPEEAEVLGRKVREAWVRYCVATGKTDKTDWLLAWEALDPWTQGVDRAIGTAVAQFMLDHDAMGYEVSGSWDETPDLLDDDQFGDDHYAELPLFDLSASANVSSDDENAPTWKAWVKLGLLVVLVVVLAISVIGLIASAPAILESLNFGPYFIK